MRDACTFDWPGVTGARREYDAARAAGLPVEWHDALPLPWPTGGGVVLGEQFQVDPLALLRLLADEAEEHGAVVMTGQRVRRIGLRAPYRVHTDHGSLDADLVVVATNLPILDRGGFFARMVPQRSYAVVAEVPDHGMAGMYLSAQTPGRSVRALGEDTLMVGGEGHVTGRSTPTSARLDTLREWTRDVFPGAEFTHGWSAQDYSTVHDLPFAGPLLPGHDHLLMAGGYSKWGFSNGVAAGLALAGRVLGGHQEWASVLQPWHGNELRGTASAVGANASVALELGVAGCDPVRRSTVACVRTWEGSSPGTTRSPRGTAPSTGRASVTTARSWKVRPRGGCQAADRHPLRAGRPPAVTCGCRRTRASVR